MFKIPTVLEKASNSPTCFHKNGFVSSGITSCNEFNYTNRKDLNFPEGDDVILPIISELDAIWELN